MTPISRILATAILVAFAALVPAAAQPADVYRSVVRIEAATQVPDYSTPWSTGNFSRGIGTGFIIGKNRILTNAHVVSNAQFLLVTVHGSPEKYPAKIEFIAHDCDLALLSVEDFRDFEDFPVFELGDAIPVLESEVRVIGYPIGGDRISVTRGVVSRIDFQPYSHTRIDSHLVIQIDAAINPGNSGGPVLQDGRVVGVAFQGLRQADNTGYIIPTPVVRRFLKDIENGSYDHYVDIAISDFQLVNPAMRRALGLPNNSKGVLVTTVVPTGSSDGHLEAGDILMAIDGLEIDSTGMVELDGEKVTYQEVVERKFAGDKVELRIVRGGTWHDIEIELKPLDWARKMLAVHYGKRPRYVVFGGLVFQPLNTNLFASEKFTDVTVRRLYTDYVNKGLFQKHRDVVILTRVLGDAINSHLPEFQGRAVERINGEEVTDLAHAQALLARDPDDGFHVIELFGASRPVVLPASGIAAANARIARNYGIQRPYNLED
ncbi:MAG: trypsin-like peptidase domain-containing protein [Luteolibacter sp.]